MESQIISYYNPNYQSQSRAARPADDLMGQIGESVEITRLKEQVKKLESGMNGLAKLADEQTEILKEWEYIGISRWGVDTPDDVDYYIQGLVDEDDDEVEELEEELAAEKEQRRLDNEKAREVIQSCCNEIEDYREIAATHFPTEEGLDSCEPMWLPGQQGPVGANSKTLLRYIEEIEEDREHYKKLVEKQASKHRPAEEVTRVKDLLEIDDGYMADSEGEVWKRCDPKFGHLGKAVADGMMEVFQERGITIIDGDTPKRTRSGKSY